MAAIASLQIIVISLFWELKKTLLFVVVVVEMMLDHQAAAR